MAPPCGAFSFCALGEKIFLGAAVSSEGRSRARKARAEAKRPLPGGAAQAEADEGGAEKIFLGGPGFILDRGGVSRMCPRTDERSELLFKKCQKHFFLFFFFFSFFFLGAFLAYSRNEIQTNFGQKTRFIGQKTRLSRAKNTSISGKKHVFFSG